MLLCAFHGFQNEELFRINRGSSLPFYLPTQFQAKANQGERFFEDTEKSLDFAKYAGKLSESETLLKFFKANDEFDKNLSRLAVYAFVCFA